MHKSIFSLLLFFLVPLFGFAQESLEAELNNLTKENAFVEAYKFGIKKAPRQNSELAARLYVLAGDAAREHAQDQEVALQGEWKTNALEAYKKALLLKPQPKIEKKAKQGAVNCLDYFYSEGAEAFAKDNYGYAYSMMTKYLSESEKISPRSVNPFAYFFAGRAAKQLGKNEIAEKHLESALTKGFDDPMLYFDLADLYLANKDTSKSMQIIRAGITIFPKNQKLALEYLDISQRAAVAPEELESELKRLTATFPNNEKIYVHAGNAWQYLMNLQTEKRDFYFLESKAAYKDALDINPNNFEANFQVGWLLYTHAVDIIKDQRYDLDVFVLNRILDEVNALHREAVPYVERARQVAPNDPKTLKALRGLYYNLNKTDEYNKISEGIDE